MTCGDKAIDVLLLRLHVSADGSLYAQTGRLLVECKIVGELNLSSRPSRVLEIELFLAGTSDVLLLPWELLPSPGCPSSTGARFRFSVLRGRSLLAVAG